MIMSAPKRLYRRSAGGRVAGVCAGIADYLDSDVTLIRLAWMVLSIVPGGLVGGLLAYLAAWIIVPDRPGQGVAADGTRKLTRSATERQIAGVCGGLAEYFSVDATIVRLGWAVLTVVPGCIVLGVFAYAVAWFVMPVQTTAHAAPGAPDITGLAQRAS
jgi:phage shock protein PspC (stress-responsive transcriptional regulator)